MTQRQRTEAANDASAPDQAMPTRPRHSSVSSTNSPQAGTGSRPTQEDLDDAAMAMEGLYIISVAARILDMHPQTLRKYERLGLVRPGRTLGMLRLYSREDIRKLRLIRHLSDEMGLNLAGVEFALTAVQNLLTLRSRLVARLGEDAAEAVDEELELLFRSLNLPVRP